MHPRKIELLEETKSRAADIMEWYVATHAEIGEPVDGEVQIPGEDLMALNEALDALAIEILWTDDAHFEGRPNLKLIKK